MDTNRTHQIAAVTVNHNTSAYMELMLRSFYACHPTGLSFSLTVFDNGSTDDMQELRRYAAQKRISIRPSGFPLTTAHNSHGEILRRFVLDNPDCTHYLFLDADVCFVQANTIHNMLTEMEQTSTAFGIGPRMSWDGVNEIPLKVRQANPDICDARLHPCCALIPNTTLFRTVVDLIGLSCARYLWAEREEYFDTFKLMTRVMLTHGLAHIRSSAMIQHFFAVSYDWDTEETIQHKARMRNQSLQALRIRDEADTM
jgi:GT2 family glycosyltransferase